MREQIKRLVMAGKSDEEIKATLYGDHKIALEREKKNENRMKELMHKQDLSEEETIELKKLKDELKEASGRTYTGAEEYVRKLKNALRKEFPDKPLCYFTRLYSLDNFYWRGDSIQNTTKYIKETHEDVNKHINSK